MSDSQTIRVDQLTKEHIDHTVSFRRPAGDLGSPVVTGTLVATETATYTRGNIPRTGYVITIGFFDRWGALRGEAFGPVPASHEVTVSAKPRKRRRDFLDDAPADIVDFRTRRGF